jgi:hypothetical protein
VGPLLRKLPQRRGDLDVATGAFDDGHTPSWSY